jgi:hypothetical protein
MVERFAACPDHLRVQLPAGLTDMIVQLLQAEADEMGCFIGTKANKHWMWIAMDAKTPQVIAFHGGIAVRKGITFRQAADTFEVIVVE